MFQHTHKQILLLVSVLVFSFRPFHGAHHEWSSLITKVETAMSCELELVLIYGMMVMVEWNGSEVKFLINFSHESRGLGVILDGLKLIF
jgi:hypothetical protein